MSGRLSVFVFALIAFGILDTSLSEVWAQSHPVQHIAYQGLAYSAAGVPVTDGPHSVIFRLSDLRSDEMVWEETAQVTVQNGIVEHLLGSVVPLSAVRFNRRLTLAVEFDGTVLLPATEISAAPYALGILDGLRVEPVDDVYSAANIVHGSVFNRTGDGVRGATIGGGGNSDTTPTTSNQVQGDYGTVGGGWANIAGGSDVEPSLDGFAHATVGGGYRNEAARLGATVGGGEHNWAWGKLATIPGGKSNWAMGDYSLAAGFKANATYEGTFVWADRSQDAAFVTTGPNQFLIRAVGGVGINTDAPAASLSVGTDGSRWNVRTGEGDFRIGTPTHRLKIGIAIDGSGAGDARIFASGGTSRIVLGSGTTDVALVTSTGLSPSQASTFDLGTTALVWRDIYTQNPVSVASDARLKRNIAAISGAADVVHLLRPVTYSWIDQADPSVHAGLIAQEVAQILPHLVIQPDDPASSMAIRYTELIPYLIGAIQDQQAQLTAQQREIERLRTEMKAKPGL